MLKKKTIYSSDFSLFLDGADGIRSFFQYIYLITNKLASVRTSVKTSVRVLNRL